LDIDRGAGAFELAPEQNTYLLSERCTFASLALATLFFNDSADNFPPNS